MDIIAGFTTLFSGWEPVFFAILGTLIGLFAGATPGLSASAAIALLIPITFYMDRETKEGNLPLVVEYEDPMEDVLTDVWKVAMGSEPGIHELSQLNEALLAEGIVLKDNTANFKVGATRRWLMQALGTEVFRRKIDPKTWLNAMGRQLAHCGTSWIVTDVRFKNEKKMIDMLGGQTVRVLRPGYSVPEDAHPSEKEMAEVLLPTFMNDFTPRFDEKILKVFSPWQNRLADATMDMCVPISVK